MDQEKVTRVDFSLYMYAVRNICIVSPRYMYISQKFKSRIEK